MEKSAQIRIWLDFFFYMEVSAAHSLKFVFDRIPACSSLSNSLLICSRAEKGTFPFLNTGCALSFTLSLAFNSEHSPRTPEKNLGKRLFEFFLRFIELDVVLFILRQNVLSGQSHTLNFSIQSVPNRLSEFF